MGYERGVNEKVPAHDSPAREQPAPVAAGTRPTAGNGAYSRLIQAAGTGSGALETETAEAIESRRGGGAALPEAVNTEMGERFGVDFGAVRVHTDADADGLNDSVQARAFTTGTDIFFSRGNYNPGTSSGRELLAHELTHVVQQSAGTADAVARVSSPGDREEVEARSVASTVAHSAGPAAVDDLGAGGNGAIARLVQRTSRIGRVQREEAEGGQSEAGPAEAEPGNAEGEAHEAVGVGDVKLTFPVPETPLLEKSLKYAKLSLSAGGELTYAAKPAGGEATAKVSGEASAGADPKYQVEVEHEFEKIATGVLEGYTPKVAVKGEAGASGGYKLGLEGQIEGELTEFSFGFTFLEAEGKGEIEFMALEAEAAFKMPPYEFVASDGSKLEVSSKVKLTAKLTPEYGELLDFFLEECAEVVTGEVAIIGGVVIAGVATIAGFILTWDDGDEMAKIIDDASLARTEYIDAFMAAVVPGNTYQFDNDYKMEGYLQGNQWLQNLRDGTGNKGIPVPESVLKQKVSQMQGQARANATAAINTYLHQLLVQQYWKIHWGRKFMGESIETVFQMLMEGNGFGRPAPNETGQGTPVGASAGASEE